MTDPLDKSNGVSWDFVTDMENCLYRCFMNDDWKPTKKQQQQIASFSTMLTGFIKKNVNIYPSIEHIPSRAWAEMLCCAAVDYAEDREITDFHPGNLVSEKFLSYLDDEWLKEHLSIDLEIRVDEMIRTGCWISYQSYRRL